MEIKVIDSSTHGKKKKPAFEFPSAFIKNEHWEKVRKVHLQLEKDGPEPMLIIRPIRTKTNRERVNKVPLPQGSHVKLAVKN